MITKSLAKQIRILGLDVDGVLTDNSVFLGSNAYAGSIELKRFGIQDGLGHALMAQTDVEIIWVSGRKSPATTERGKELHVKTILQVRSHTKADAVDKFLRKRGFDWSEMAFVGDDLIDIPVMERCALPIAVANARPEVKKACRFTTVAEGGHGAVREVIEELLRARGEFEFAMKQYLAHGSHPRKRSR